MKESISRFRHLGRRLPGPEDRRLVVLTGARQTGKTTLARARWPHLRYLNLDDLELRRTVRDVPTVRWPIDVGPAVIDEAQKEPAVFDKVKHAFDAGSLTFSALLGSSRILLMEKVRETLAGRAFVFDLWPLMPSELLHAADTNPPPPLLDQLLDPARDVAATLRETAPALLPDDDAPRRHAFEHLCRWGGMPELLRLDDADRREWLRSYQQTFLERDLADLARLHDLEPFAALQKLCMLRTGGLLSFSEYARDAKVAPTTARRYLEYLRMSYQVLLLQPYARNITSAVVKTPKVYWVDVGILRHGTRQWGDLTGAQFESVVVAEVHKWVSTAGRAVDLSFYRTRSGLEVDLLAESDGRVLGIEVKARAGAERTDCRGLRALANALGDRWRGGLVVHDGTAIEELDAEARLWGVPAHRLLT